MVGHTGKLEPTIRAIEVLDECLGKILTALSAAGGEALITADHGNAECLWDTETGSPHTAHTCFPVPFLYVGNRQIQSIAPSGTLANVAPTLLYLLGLPIPPEMTGTTLLRF